MIPIKISREKSRALNCLDPQNTIVSHKTWWLQPKHNFAIRAWFCNQSKTFAHKKFCICATQTITTSSPNLKKTLIDFFATTRSYCDGGIVTSHDVAMMWSEVVKDKQSEARGFLSWKRIWSLLVESHVNAMTQMTNPFFGGERRTKGRRFLWVWVEERSEGKYSEWRGGTTQCQRDSPLYISIPGAVKKLNVWVKNDSKEESSIHNLKL